MVAEIPKDMATITMKSLKNLIAVNNIMIYPQAIIFPQKVELVG